ncbi:hypothetical protein GGR56DRAFT_627701 [Xylariaceae sp. FL0804]|nr:hypothetical protein GGR56DRAFT_627701 [Xylariaceae sp. FL0804]
MTAFGCQCQPSAHKACRPNDRPTLPEACHGTVYGFAYTLLQLAVCDLKQLTHEIPMDEDADVIRVGTAKGVLPWKSNEVDDDVINEVQREVLLTKALNTRQYMMPFWVEITLPALGSRRRNIKALLGRYGLRAPDNQEGEADAGVKRPVVLNPILIECYHIVDN